MFLIMKFIRKVELSVYIIIVHQTIGCDSIQKTYLKLYFGFLRTSSLWLTKTNKTKFHNGNSSYIQINEIFVN